MIDESAIRQLYSKGKAAFVTAFAEQAPALFEQYEISANDTRMSFFLAQIGHESAGLTLVEESLNYSAERLPVVWPKRYPTPEAAAHVAHNAEALANEVYGGRMGNTQDGDGWRFHGRGLIQLTGRDAYGAVGTAMGIDLENQPELAMDPQHALEVACGFWKWKGLNAICDGEGDAFLVATKRINGGTLGIDDRRSWLTKAHGLIGSSGAPAPALSGPQKIAAVQRALLAQGFPDIGAADGISGKRTQAAIAKFRDDNDLPEGGIDDALLAALGVAG
jgi:putative chitinase